MAGDIQTNLLLKISTDTSNATKGLGQLKGSLDGINSTIAKVAAGIASAFALRDVINSTQAWANQLDNLHDTLGLSGDEAAKWNYQARLVGTTADDIAMAFSALTNKIGNSLPAIKEGTSDFDKWGIKVLDSNDSLLGASAILDQVREKVNALGPGLGARQLEFDLFSKAGGRLHDFLSLSNDEIERMNQDLKALGLPTNVDELEAMNRESNRLGIIFDSIKVKLGSALLPVLLAAGRGLTQLASTAKVLGEALRAPLSVIKEVVDRLNTFIADVKAVGFGGAIQKLIDDFLAKARELLPKIGEELDKMGPIGWAIKLLLLAGTMSLAAGFVTNLLGTLVGTLTGAAAWIRAGAGMTPLTFVVGAAVLMSLVAFSFEPAGVRPTVDELVRVVKEILVIGGLTLAAAGALLGMPIALAVGIGIVLGLAAMEFAESGVFKDIGPRLLQWLANNLVQHLPFPLSLAGNALRVAVPLIVEWRMTNTQPPPTFTPPGGRDDWRNTVSTPVLTPLEGAIDQMTIEERQRWVRQMFPQNFMTGGPQVVTAADGFHGVVGGPTMFLAGERPGVPERVDIGPVGSGAGTVVNLTVNVGSVDDRRRIKDLTDAISQELMGRIGSRRAVAF